jgi:predicted RNA-binding protein with PIN domain
VVLLVDGYNVSKLRWPELPIPEQRRRLVDALAGLAARTGADVHAVFDGVEPIEPPLPPERRRSVRVTFSPADVEADDVLIKFVGEVPLRRPVVVVSSDRRVQTEVSLLGANVISSSQLLHILGR